MKLIILRGLPGCGKTTLANKIGLEAGAPIIHGDDFKLEYMKIERDFKKALQYSYDKITENIKEYISKDEKVVVVEELFNDQTLVNNIIQISKENNIDTHWFRIKRDLDKLLETEAKRERKVKNTLEDFQKLEKELDNIIIEGEVVLENNSNIDELKILN
ncbi:MAG: AAA family ATPase [bacterium]